MAPISKEEEFVQAVVVVDGFSGAGRLGPLLTDGRPKTLLPVVNCPLLEYVLEFLHSSNIVNEVLLFCTTNVYEIREFLSTSRWLSEGEKSGMKISLVVSETCFSVGDALRDIYDKRLVRDDFILVSGDVVSNIQLKHIFDMHKERRKREKTMLMTMLYKRAAYGRGAFRAEPKSTIAFDEKTNRLLHLQVVTDECGKISIPLAVFQELATVTVCNDLIDCRISICSPEVLSLFSDNFDYQTREDFVKGIVEHEEILGNTIYLHFLEDEYAACVTNFLSYEAVSRDIINRWVFPIVPDLFAYDKQRRYVHLRYNVYRHRDVTVGRSSRLEEDVVVGGGSKIGNQTVISGSVIGWNCIIGDNVVLRNAFLWDHVRIGDGCFVNTAILADRVVLKPNSKVTKSIITYDSEVGPSSVLENVVLTPKSKGDVSSSENEGTDLSKERQNSESDVSDDCRDGEDFHNDPWRSFHTDALCYISSEDESSDEEEFGNNDGFTAMDDTKLFYAEVLDTLRRGIEEKLKCDNLVLEINGLKYAYNVTISEVNFLVTKAILEIPKKEGILVDDSVKLFAYLKEIFVKFLPLVKNYIKSGASQRDLLNGIKEFTITNDYFVHIFVKVFHFFYENDVLVEDTIVAWYGQLDNADVGERLIRDKISPFIKWLKEAEEESD